ncbi:MAG TPA: proline dehydrogenase family protein, partial [Ignavibacteriaceae bacterium]
MSFFHNLLVKTVQIMPSRVVWYFSKNYIAGNTIDDAIKKVKELNSKGILATLDVLGESIHNEDEAIAAKKEAFSVLEAIHNHRLNANLSIKPTQLGLSINEDFAFKQIRELVQKANEINNFIRIDMEDSPYTDKTINLYKKIFQEFKNVGIVLQAYLKRTYDDAVILNKLGTNYRLCKGIYIESPSIAYKDK